MAGYSDGVSKSDLPAVTLRSVPPPAEVGVPVVGAEPQGYAALAAAALAAEDEVLAVIPILGEAAGQQAVDDWVDQVVDALRAVGEAAQEWEHRRGLGADR